MKDGDRDLLPEEVGCGCGYCVYRYGARPLSNCRAEAIRGVLDRQIVKDLEGEIETLLGLKKAAQEDAGECSNAGKGGAFLMAQNVAGAIDVLVKNLNELKGRYE